MTTIKGIVGRTRASHLYMFDSRFSIICENGPPFIKIPENGEKIVVSITEREKKMKVVKRVRTGRTYQVMASAARPHLIGTLYKIIACNGDFVTAERINNNSTNGYREILSTRDIFFISARKSYVEKTVGK